MKKHLDKWAKAIGETFGTVVRAVRREWRAFRRDPAPVTAVLVVVIVFVVVLSAVSRHEGHQEAQDKREATQRALTDVARVRRVCGSAQAEKFKIVYDDDGPDVDRSEESRSWAAKCAGEHR